MPKGISFTQRGKHRDENSDYCCFSLSELHESWIIADGVTCTPGSAEYAKYFCENLKKSLSAFDAAVEIPAIESAIKQTCSELRRDYICAKISFLLLFIDHAKGAQHCFFLGDCRVGQLHNDTIQWLNLPHNIAVEEGIVEEEKICSHPERERLYKCLKARRYITPSYLLLKMDVKQKIIFSTDGFWSCYPAQLNETSLLHEPSEFIFTPTDRQDDCTLLLRIP